MKVAAGKRRLANKSKKWSAGISAGTATITATSVSGSMTATGMATVTVGGTTNNMTTTAAATMPSMMSTT